MCRMLFADGGRSARASGEQQSAAWGGGELPTSRAMSKCRVFSRGRMRFDLCIPPLISVFRPVFRDSGTCGRRGSLCFSHLDANCDIRVETNAVRGITKPEGAKTKYRYEWFFYGTRREG